MPYGRELGTDCETNGAGTGRIGGTAGTSVGSYGGGAGAGVFPSITRTTKPSGSRPMKKTRPSRAGAGWRAPPELRVSGCCEPSALTRYNSAKPPERIVAMTSSPLHSGDAIFSECGDKATTFASTGAAAPAAALRNNAHPPLECATYAICVPSRDTRGCEYTLSNDGSVSALTAPVPSSTRTSCVNP